MGTLTTGLVQLGLSTLAGDFIGEVLKTIMYLGLIVCAFAIGSKLRSRHDAKMPVQEQEADTEVTH